MNKIITSEQINTVLNAIYQTNITARDFDAVKLFFAQLTPVPESKTNPESDKSTGN